jgi:hypothetical protein
VQLKAKELKARSFEPAVNYVERGSLLRNK